MRLKRAAVSMIEEAKKIESSLTFNDRRAGKTLDMRELEPIEGWEYSPDPWPGHVVREMSPLSSVGDDDIRQLEKELIDQRGRAEDEILEPPRSGRSRGRPSPVQARSRRRRN